MVLKRGDPAYRGSPCYITDSILGTAFSMTMQLTVRGWIRADSGKLCSLLCESIRINDSVLSISF